MGKKKKANPHLFLQTPIFSRLISKTVPLEGEKCTELGTLTFFKMINDPLFAKRGVTVPEHLVSMNQGSKVIVLT